MTTHRFIEVPRGPYGFRAFAANDEVAAVAAPFPFWQYVTLSVTAGLITHFIIRAISSGRSQGKK